jgi:hypothetical protein
MTQTPPVELEKSNEQQARAAVQIDGVRVCSCSELEFGGCMHRSKSIKA